MAQGSKGARAWVSQPNWDQSDKSIGIGTYVPASELYYIREVL